MPDSHQKTLKSKVSSLVQKLAYINVGRVSPREDLDKMTALVQPTKHDGKKSLSLVSM